MRSTCIVQSIQTVSFFWIVRSKYKFYAGSRKNLIVIKPEKCKIHKQKQFLQLGLLNIRSLFMNLFTDKIDNIRNTITNVDSTASSISASFIAPKEKLQCFTTIGQEELNKRITASKPTTWLLNPVPTKLLKELSPVAVEPLLNIINSSLYLGHVPTPFKLAVIKPLIKKPQLDSSELANYRPIPNLPFMSKML